MQPTDIDPALALMAEFGQITKGTTRHINQMRQDAIFADGAVPARYKALAAMLRAVSARCEPCFKFYYMCSKPFGSARPRPNLANSSLSRPQWAGASARCGP